MLPTLTSGLQSITLGDAFHQSKETKEYCHQNGITLVYNGIYSSQFMPVERLWLFAKLYWRKERLAEACKAALEKIDPRFKEDVLEGIFQGRAAMARNEDDLALGNVRFSMDCLYPPSFSKHIGKRF